MLDRCQNPARPRKISTTSRRIVSPSLPPSSTALGVLRRCRGAGHSSEMRSNRPFFDVRLADPPIQIQPTCL